MKIIFGVHNHQPYGNFEYVSEDTYKTSYLPFIKEVEESDARVVLHFTGTLLEWLENAHPEYIEKVRLLLVKNKIEILSGGFYEPILPAIPSKFRVKQIEKMNKLIYRLFSYTPKGAWLAERVWENDLIRDLKKAGIEYTFIDEENFIPISKKPHKYYITEYNGEEFKIFVIDKSLRYMIPFEDKEVSLQRLKEGDFFVAFDDGEKFGSWPGTYNLIYKSKWLKDFFTMLHRENVDMLLPNEIIREKSYCGGLAYLDSGSYPEMQKWALPSNVNREEIKKCNWKNFFVKYTESNIMHKLNLLNCKYYDHGEEDNIMASQANDAYWHGTFGGIYISHLRNAIYKKILETQKSLTKNNITEDIDFDGYDEVIIKNKKIIVGVDPDQGGRIIEFGNLLKAYNFQNALTRRYEPYHEDKVIEDWYDKFSLLDHFLQFPSFEQIKKCKFNELGDFINNPYEFKVMNDNKIELSRNGNLWFNGNKLNLTVQKDILIEENEMIIQYTLINPNEFDLPFHFATEFNLNFISNTGDERYINFESSKQSVNDDFQGEIRSLKFKDEFFDLELTMNFDRSLVWSYPIKTLIISENSEIESYQGTSIFINKIGEIKSNSKYSFDIQLKL